MFPRCALTAFVSFLIAGTVHAQTKDDAKKFISTTCANFRYGITTQFSVTFEGDSLIKLEQADGAVPLKRRYVYPLSEIDPQGIVIGHEKNSNWFSVVLVSRDKKGAADLSIYNSKNDTWTVMPRKADRVIIAVPDMKTATQVKNAFIFLLSQNPR